MEPYCISVPVQDKPPGESLHQVLVSLQELDVIISDVFTKIAGRIRTEREKVNEIVQRVTVAQSKVELISRNPSRATQVYSAAKYPAPTVLPDLQRVCQPSAKPPSAKPLDYVLTKGQAVGTSKDVDVSEINHGLHHVLMLQKDGENPDGSLEVDQAKNGLGRLPCYFPSISSILLFNTSDNPYREYSSINNLEGVGGKDRAKEDAELAPAPSSLANGEYLPMFGTLGFEYKPDIGDMPTFQLPQNLPLGKLANIQFGATVDQLQTIAPSVAQLQLPGFAALPPAPIANSRVAAPASYPAAPAPAVPSAPPSVQAQSSASSFANTTAASQAAPPAAAAVPAAVPVAPPPPPAPPMPPADSLPLAVATMVPAAQPGRQDLLSQIQAGKKLRKASHRKNKEQKDKGKSKPSGGGMDLMSALAIKLQQKRKALTGKATVEKEKDNNSESPSRERSRSKSHSPAKMHSVVTAAMAAHKAKEAEDHNDWEDDE